MSSKTISEFLTNLSLFHWAFFVFFASSLAFFCWFWKFIKIQIRFGKNLKRTVYFLMTSEAKKLDTEKNTLNKLEIFNLDKEVKDISINDKVLQTVKKNAVYIVGYDNEYDKYVDLFATARNTMIPIIVFANPGEIKKKEHWDIFNGYIYCDVANTTNRIAMILMSMMKIVPSHKA